MKKTTKAKKIDEDGVPWFHTLHFDKNKYLNSQKVFSYFLANIFEYIVECKYFYTKQNILNWMYAMAAKILTKNNKKKCFSSK